MIPFYFVLISCWPIVSRVPVRNTPTRIHTRPVLTPEEKQRNMEIGKRYNKMMAKEHNDRMADYTLKIRLRDDAINNLPELLQHAARQKDTNPPPTNRRMFSFTPPIPGIDSTLVQCALCG